MLMDGEWGMAALRAFHDISSTHHGYELSVDYGFRWVRGRWSIAPTVGVSYKSAALSDYYWGVHADEATLRAHTKPRVVLAGKQACALATT